MIQVSNVSKSYTPESVALQPITFNIEAGEVVYIIGESGSGKSTLLKIIAGLEDADSGNVRLDDLEITGPAHNLVPGYDELAYVPQDFKLQQFWTVATNIAKKISHYPYADKMDRVEELLKLCKLEAYADRYPRELSGGQQQRIAMAAAVSDEPEVVLLDEPFSNLDLPMKAAVRKDIIGMLRKLGITVVLVSHDPAEALAVADKIIILQEGKLEQIGRPVDLYQNPTSHYAAKFLGPINELTLEKEVKLIRPEAIALDPKGKYAGKVMDCIFMGMHYHVILQSDWSRDELLIYSDQPYASGQLLKFCIR
ncbi:ABC transporter ATP-binding protein [Reichenbachiella carrageenanivorans]|uniref:ABC transporter ATP-binding protein n=1 Tax=Reichenbachiella carrageenanivorans TaxID=2979869 RepID=A0ABY6D194_9BACT|nr:ABC transporter ATP-binding protein [Reichenbachiella carrageenanivorans]UXX79949.1 ABC transporter ATP-binding protein [Reichenbachiella carrageenanivorans]